MMSKIKNFVGDTLSYYTVLVCMSLALTAGVINPVIGLMFLVIAIIMVVENKERIKVKYFDPSLPEITPTQNGDWVDLRAAETVELKAGEYKLIPLGIGMILPNGYEAHILPRSSTPSNFGVICANSQGIIDNSYSGDADEWKFPAVAIRDTVIKKGDRICQFRIVRNQPRIVFERVATLKKKSRGGIGSTGRR